MPAKHGGVFLLRDTLFRIMCASLKMALVFALLLPSAGVSYAQQSNQEQSERYAEAGQKALAAGQFSEARSDFEQLARLQPAVAEVHATLAVIYFKQREYELAIREIQTAQKLKPGLAKLDSLLGLSQSELSDFKEALPHLERGFRQSADTEVRRMCGLQLLRAYTNLGRDSDAVETALSLNKSYPGDPEVLYHTGRIYGNMAYTVMESLHDKAPDSIWMLQAQGEANESEKNYDSAIMSFQHVLAMDAHRSGIHYRLGRVYLARFQTSRNPEDRVAAKREFTAELEGDPANGNAAYELAGMAVEDNDLSTAQKQYQAVLARFPDFEQALVGLGGVFLDSHAAEQAIAPLERATRLDPGDEVAWYRLSQAQRSAGNREAAQKALETFRSLHASASSTTKSAAADQVTPQVIGPTGQP
jgi:tetratricopeptide (TPR) repeat protein